MSKILILDDDQDLLSIVKSLLKKKGFEVWTFADWQKAWENIKRNKPNLILLDVFLKGIDGIGKALVEGFLQKGASVSTCSRTEEKLSNLKKEFSGKSLFR